ncbi:hypothetical protein Emed_006390 [Eimeria media]
MRLSLLAVGLLAGVPDVAWGLNSDLALKGAGYPATLETRETLKPTTSLIAPFSSPNSFFGVSTARRGLQQLQEALQAARRSISQRLARGRSTSTAPLMHKEGSSPDQQGAQQPPPTSQGQTSVTVGASPLRRVAPRYGATPAATLLLRRGAVPHPLAAIKLPHRVEEMKSQITSPPASRKVFSTYTRPEAGRAGALTEPFFEELSEEDLKATQEVKLKKEAGYKEQIVEVVQANIEDIERRKKAAGVKTEVLPVEQLCMEALTHMTGARKGTEEIILRDIREVTTDKQLMAECLARQTKILGVGGVGVVIEVEILDEVCKDALGMDKLAVKMMYVDLKERDISLKEAKAVYQRLQVRYEAETQPLKLIGAAAKPGQSFTDMLKEKHWAVPGFSASAGDSGQAYIHKQLLLDPHLLLSELMLGDGLKLLHFRGLLPGARVPMPVREYMCEEMIRSTAKLHELGLAHYDIKADNILLGRDGTVNLGDFGMCGPINMPKQCADGITPLYADPEQVSCLQEGGHLSMKAQYDSWSLGMTCYLMMTTRGFPYKIRNNARMLDHISSLAARSIFRSRARQGNPEQELRDVGVSRMAASSLSGNSGCCLKIRFATAIAVAPTVLGGTNATAAAAHGTTRAATECPPLSYSVGRVGGVLQASERVEFADSPQIAADVVALTGGEVQKPSSSNNSTKGSSRSTSRKAA